MSQKNWKMGLQQDGFTFSSENKVEGPWPKNTARPLITVLANEDILTLSGKDAVKFLQGQSTCDVQKLPEGEAVLGACCTPKGRIIANFRVFKIDEEHLCLTLPKGQADILNAAISKYAAFYKVILGTEHAWVRLGLCVDSFTIETLLDHFEKPTLCLSINEKKAEIWVCEEHINELLKTLKEHYMFAPTDAWCLSDIQQGIAWITPEISESLLPQECNWDLIQGVNFKKGCYTGQEIVARLHYRGKPKTRVQHFTVNNETTVCPGHKIINTKGKVCGQVVNAVYNPSTQQLHLLASIRLDQIDPLLHLENNATPLKLQSLPYAVVDTKES